MEWIGLASIPWARIWRMIASRSQSPRHRGFFDATPINWGGLAGIERGRTKMKTATLDVGGMLSMLDYQGVEKQLVHHRRAAADAEVGAVTAED